MARDAPGRRCGEAVAFSDEVTAIEPRYPAVLVFGCERSGVSRDVLPHADQAIPMLGLANSLNVAIACAIALHEIRRHAVHHSSVSAC